VFEYLLNIIGSEWIIIIFVALILLLGTKRFPDAAKKIGKIVGEYKKAKDAVEKQMKDVTKENLEVSGPVKDERQKLDVMSKTLGIDSKSKSDEELKGIIKNKIGQPENETQTKK
jgi:sec-independent protein translocase protein TatA